MAQQEIPMKDSRSTKRTKPGAMPKSKNVLCEPAVFNEQGGERRSRSFTIIDDDWTRRARKRALRNDTIWLPAAKPKKTGEVAEEKYEPNEYERAVLAKQEQRLKDQVRVPLIRFVE